MYLILNTEICIFFKSELNILTTEIKKALDENKRVIVLCWENEDGLD